MIVLRKMEREHVYRNISTNCASGPNARRMLLPSHQSIYIGSQAKTLDHLFGCLGFLHQRGNTIHSSISFDPVRVACQMFCRHAKIATFVQMCSRPDYFLFSVMIPPAWRSRSLLDQLHFSLHCRMTLLSRSSNEKSDAQKYRRPNSPNSSRTFAVQLASLFADWMASVPISIESGDGFALFDAPFIYIS